MARKQRMIQLNWVQEQLGKVSILVCAFIQLTGSLSFTDVRIPALVQRNSNFWLSCQFELIQGSDKLYTVKWYKNNDEFYRLLQADSEQADSGRQPQQKQDFQQPGVNVMMSWSNATHVRLLNASIESEGLYACEISTQNLSTIRYEREIRVYVTPHSRLNIIGFRSRYSAGDKVDLVCASDYSRPQPALSWFINGRRIAHSDNRFQLDHQLKSKLNEPTLFSTNLGLKFKLSPQLLAWLLHENANSTPANQRDQSRGRPESQWPYHQQLALDRLELRLQCKYRLAEVSDVTYNELLVAAPDSGRRKWRASRRAEPSEEVKAVRLAKSSDNRLLQSVSPAGRGQRLVAELARDCRAGAPQLQPDDPVIVEAPESGGGLEELEAEPEQSVVRVDCLTISQAVAGTSSTSRAGNSAQASGLFCDDLVARRLALISGKHQAREELGARPFQQRPPARAREPAIQVGYLSWNQGDTNRLVSELNSERYRDGHSYTDNDTDIDVDMDTQSSGRANNTAADSGVVGALEAPPLLEWFINNQEANRSNLKYAPLLAPPLDYAQYFANFDSRPTRQRLGLELALDKHHFMTPDSKLRLRCTSTQAQVLLTQLAELLILPVANDHLAGQAWQQNRPRTLQDQPNKRPQHARAFAQNGAPCAYSSTLIPVIYTIILFLLLL